MAELTFDPRGRVDPTSLRNALAARFTASPLNGVVPPDGAKFGIVTGSPDEWARFGVANAKQESGFNPRSTNLSDPGGSYGLYQFNQHQFGLHGNAYDPAASTEAFARSAEHYVPQGGIGSMGAIFGSIRRPWETTQHLASLPPAQPGYGPEGLNEVGPEGPRNLSLLNIKAAEPSQSMMALGGPKPEGAPVADPNDDPRLQNRGGMSPLVMMGLGLLGSGMEGKGYAAGLLGGANAAQGFEQNRLSELKSDRGWAVEQAKLPLQLQQAQQALDLGKFNLTQHLPLQAAQQQQSLELGKLNLDQAKRQFVPNIGADAYGMPTPGFIDPVNMKVYGINGQPLSPNGMGGVGAFGGTGGATGPTAGGGQPDFSKTGDEFIKTLPPTLAREIQGYVEGRNVLSPAQMRGPAGEAKLRMIMQADPNYDYTAAPARMALRKSYEGGGKQFQELQAIGTVAEHMSELAKKADKIDNYHSGQYSIATQPMNSFLDWKREKNQDPVRADFIEAKSAVMNELAKAYRGGVVTDSAVKDFEKGINTASTPEEYKTVIGTLNRFLASKRQQLEDGYKGVMGHVTLPEQFSTTNARTKALFDGVDAWSTGIKPPKDEPASGGPGVARIQAMPLEDVAKLDPKSLSVDELKAIVARRRAGR